MTKTQDLALALMNRNAIAIRGAGMEAGKYGKLEHSYVHKGEESE